MEKRKLLILLVVLFFLIASFDVVVSKKPVKKPMKIEGVYMATTDTLYEHYDYAWLDWMGDMGERSSLSLPVNVLYSVNPLDLNYPGMVFTIGATGPNMPFYLTTIKINNVISHSGSIDADIKIDVYDYDSSGTCIKGKSLSSGIINTATILKAVSYPNDMFRTVEFNMSPTVQLLPDKQYCFILTTMGTDATSFQVNTWHTTGFFTVDGVPIAYDIGTYPGGAQIWFNNDAWNSLSTMPFSFALYGINTSAWVRTDAISFFVRTKT